MEAVADIAAEEVVAAAAIATTALGLTKADTAQTTIMLLPHTSRIPRLPVALGGTSLLPLLRGSGVTLMVTVGLLLLRVGMVVSLRLPPAFVTAEVTLACRLEWVVEVVTIRTGRMITRADVVVMDRVEEGVVVGPDTNIKRSFHVLYDV